MVKMIWMVVVGVCCAITQSQADTLLGGHVTAAPAKDWTVMPDEKEPLRRVMIDHASKTASVSIHFFLQSPDFVIKTMADSFQDLSMGKPSPTKAAGLANAISITSEPAKPSAVNGGAFPS
jgi:hypothetical protein